MTGAPAAGGAAGPGVNHAGGLAGPGSNGRAGVVTMYSRLSIRQQWVSVETSGNDGETAIRLCMIDHDRAPEGLSPGCRQACVVTGCMIPKQRFDRVKALARRRHGSGVGETCVLRRKCTSDAGAACR